MEIDRHEDETGEGPSKEVVESDSGDSLFLTQKPVPQAVRTRSLPRLSQRSTPVSPIFLEDTGSSSEAEDGLERRKKRPHLPKYNFPFLKQNKSKSREDDLLGSHRNTTIHYYAMGGFFNCVREMWPNGKRSNCFESPLPTADAESEEITPISEDEKSDYEDIKIIDKKLFVYSLKPKITKSSQPWFKDNIEGNENNKKAKLKAKATKTTSNFSPGHHFGNRKMLTQPTSEGLQMKGDEQLAKSNKHGKLQDSDSDATFIEDYEPSVSRHIAVERPTKDASEKLTEHKSAKVPVNDVSALEEPDDTESQSLLKNMQSYLSSSKDSNNENRLLKRKKKKKHKDVELGVENENQVTEDVAKNGKKSSLVLFEDNSTNWPLPVLHDDIIRRKKKKTRDRFTNKKKECIAENVVKDDLETTLRTAPESVICNTETEVNRQRPNEGAEQSTSCLLVEPLNSDGMICKEKKKHKKKKGDLENAEIETTCASSGHVQVLNTLQLDNLDSIAVDEEVFDVSDRKRKKHKKKRETASDNCNDEEDISVKKVKKKLKLLNTEENSLSKSIVSHERSELVNHKISAPDSITTQSDESVSVQKRKKKRQASFIVAETVENSHLPLSQFGNGHEADTHGISTNGIETESAETGGHLQEPEFGNRVKKKKKHIHDNTNEFYKKDTENFGPNAKATETTNMSERVKSKCRSNEGKECDSTEVAHPQSDESKRLKKKKKSKHERHNTVTEITIVPQTRERVEGEDYLLSPNPTENPVTKKKNKGKYFDNDDGVAEEKAVETTELEQNTVKRKKQNKDMIIDKDHSISSLLQGEMSPSSGRPVKNSRTIVKKKLYNPVDNLLE